VSGARPKDLLERFTLPQSLNRSSTLNVRGVKLDSLSPSGDSFKTLRENTHSFRVDNPQQASMRVVPKTNQPLRSRYVELAHTDFDRSISRSGDALTIHTRAGDSTLGSLQITPTRNGFTVGHRSRDIDLGHSLARDLSRSSKTPEAMLASDARVESLIINKDGAYLVKMYSTQKWLKIAPEGVPSVDIHMGWQARVADTSNSANSYNLAWIEGNSITHDLGSGALLYVELPPTRAQQPIIRMQPRGPPPGGIPPGEPPAGARPPRSPPPPPGGIPPGGRSTGGTPPERRKPIVFVTESDEIRGIIDPHEKIISLDVVDLPDSAKRSPENLTKLVRAANFDVLDTAIAAAEPHQPIKLAASIVPGEHPLVAHLKAGNKALAADILARDPVGAKQILATDLSERLPAIDRFLQHRRFSEALHHLK
jgi:hypothetical protein